jgi:D-cysteine desulfhydrase family pyridoxal phosphate-dependent enzyme
MFKRVSLAHLPTGIERLDRISKILDGPELMIKRDDQTGLAFGGNKTRKLEYLVGEALEQGAETLITTGTAQSNHCRQTAAAAARCGLGCVLVLVGPQPDQPTANLFLDRLLGAEIIWTEKKLREITLADSFKDLEEKGKKPYLIPYGGSNAVGAFAYFQAYSELYQQMNCSIPDWIVFASSSGGTQAGLAVGIGSDPKPKLVGISVDEPADQLRKNVQSIAADLIGQLNNGTRISKNEILVIDDYTGDGYGMMNDLDREAIHLFAEQEGILLDPVYTGRAAGGMIDLVRKGFFKEDDLVLFWHTGGTPGLFADQYLPFL